ncbi:MAG TPA: nucleoside 2-deoxyribosyltransferase domain-containing protein [Sphingobacteriaceae bacterium]
MKPKIYLAGGFVGGWQEKVKDTLGDNFVFFDPQKHSLSDVEKYTNWDLYHVDRCDILLGYMSGTNPSGYGLALEIGFAKAKNKLIILVDERSNIDDAFKRYFSICSETANICFPNLNDAIDYLSTFRLS